MAEVRLGTAKAGRFSASAQSTGGLDRLMPHTESDSRCPRCSNRRSWPRDTRNLGNADEARSWAIVGEVNRFGWPGPDLRPVTRGDPERFEYGPLPPSLFRQIRDRFLAAA